MFLFADDRYEIFCNNLALKRASGDYIVFIQDDNCISRELLLSYGGMDEAFSPMCGDDLDLGIRLVKEGFNR